LTLNIKKDKMTYFYRRIVMVYSYAYRRQIPGFPTLSEQQQAILSFAMKKSIKIDKEVVEYATKNLLLEERQEFESFLRSIQEGNTIIVSSLFVLSDRVDELIKVINCILTHKVDLWIASTGMLLNRETKMVEIFPLLNTLREENNGKSRQIGRPKGSKSSSKFDVYYSQVVQSLTAGMSVSAIARELEVSRSSLKDYIESRNIKEFIENMGRYISKEKVQGGVDNIILICPFEEAAKKHKEKVL